MEVVHSPVFKPSSHFSAFVSRRSLVARVGVLVCLLACLQVALTGCNRFHHDTYDPVWVSVRQTYLHDRVAAVSARVAPVVNGQKLQVLEKNRRFLKVKTEKGEIGWVEERSVLSLDDYNTFAKLSQDHKNDPAVAKASLRDDLFMHLEPGRNTEHFFLLAGSTKVELLQRASVVRPQPGQSSARPVVAKPAANPASTASDAPQANAQANVQTNAQANAQAAAQTSAAAKPADPNAPPIALEDWWLVRDGQGHTGWLLSSRLDVDVPDEIGIYAEGQRIVGAWVIATVTDDQASTPNHVVPEYLTLMSAPKSGQPFDFDQVRVFTWSLKRHRYETAFRLKPIQGFLPLRITAKNGGTPAGFSFQISGDNLSQLDANTGVPRASQPRTLNYQFLDTSVKRIGPDFGPLPSNKDKKDDQQKPGAKGKKGSKKK